MPLFSELAIRNFKGYREKTTIPLNQSNYFVGPNNSGKSAILHAMLCFFQEDRFSPTFLNKTELRGKKEGFNRSEITLVIDISQVKSQKAANRLRTKYGDVLSVSKHFTQKVATGALEVRFFINDEECDYGSADSDVRKILDSVNVSYIHPQEADALLQRAQEKLRDRLLANFGRHHSIATNLKTLQEAWSELRKSANEYLSRSLTESLRQIWPGCETKIDLPEKIDDIVAVSEITFRPEASLPAVELLNQGTGAQSTILYQAHYLIDSDKTLHKGQYHALWLIEEPESFLHSDLAIKLGSMLNSDEWLANVQMLVTTHSSSIVGTAKSGATDINLSLVNDSSPHETKKLSEWDENEIRKISKALGDPYFDVIYYSISTTPSLILEDEHDRSMDALEAAGIPVSKRLKGITEVRRYIEVLIGLNAAHINPVYFLVDSDDGLKELRPLMSGARHSPHTAGIKNIPSLKIFISSHCRMEPRLRIYLMSSITS